MKYYSSCVGSNPMQQYVSSSATLVSSLNDTLSTYCLYRNIGPTSNSTDAASIQFTLGNMSSQVNRLQSDISCGEVQVATVPGRYVLHSRQYISHESRC